jgi:glycosyltransferase involved in cell wall biosynthesis
LTRILDISLDRDMLRPDGATEAQRRQAVYAGALSADIVLLVKARPAAAPDPVRWAGSACTAIPVRVPHALFFPFAALIRGFSLVRATAFDVVQAQEPFLSAWPAWLLARLAGARFVVGAFSDQVGNPAWRAKSMVNRITHACARFIYGRADAIRADSRVVTSRLHALGLGQARFVPFLITNARALSAPDPRRDSTRAECLGHLPGPLLLAVCRLELEKNLPMMFDALRRAIAHLPGVCLVVAGDGSQRRALETACSDLSDRVRFLGMVENKGLAPLYQAADLMLLSSDYESSARVLSEAMLAGTAVVTTDTAGAREVVEDGVTGEIVPVGDVAAFAAAIVRVAGDPDLCRRMGDAARARADAVVSQTAVVAGLRAVLGVPEFPR